MVCSPCHSRFKAISAAATAEKSGTVRTYDLNGTNMHVLAGVDLQKAIDYLVECVLK